MLRFAGVALDARRLPVGHGLDGMRQYELALAAPAVDVTAESFFFEFCFHKFHVRKNTAGSQSQMA